MTAQELMIGDWVCTKYGSAPFQILSIISNEPFKAVVSTEGFDIDIADLQPIPLTPEILKNNFEKKTMYGIFDDYFDLDIREFNDGMYIVNYHCCEMPMPDTQIVGICYVHELQHALHFLGIGKEFQL